MILLLFVAGVLGACVSSCGGGDAGRRDSAIPEMRFEVDPSLLGDAVTDSSLRLTFRPPVGLVAADPELLRRLREDAARGASTTDPLALDPVFLFAAPQGGALCRVARLRTFPPEGVTAAWIDSCRAAFARQVAPAPVTHDLYRVGRTVVAQFLARNESMVLFRLVCRGGGPAPFLIDYLAPVGDYPGLARSIESSIGSLETF